jgi:hypothetical protein
MSFLADKDPTNMDYAVLNPFTAMVLLHVFAYEIFQVGKACLSEK